jgi:hypothetical protein
VSDVDGMEVDETLDDLAQDVRHVDLVHLVLLYVFIVAVHTMLGSSSVRA